MTLTVCTYNLRDGGMDGGDTSRLHQQLDMLRLLDVDVLGLQEAKWSSGNLRLLHLAEQILGLRGFVVESQHHGCHLMLFVREPTIRVLAHRHERAWPYWHALACLEVEAEGHSQPLYLVNAHLAPSSPTIRLAEAETFALLAKRGPVIAMGDWNAAPATGDDLPPNGTDLATARRKLDRRAAQAIEDAGFTDVGAYLGDPTPTVGHDGGVAYRCDRVYTTLPPEAITGHKVIEEEQPASDHRPVVARFNLHHARGPEV